MNSAHKVSQSFSFQQANGIAYEALSKTTSISSLARQHSTSRQTVRKERDRVQYIVDKTREDDEVLFYIPVTLKWIHQVVVALVFIMNGSYRNITQFMKDLFDYSFSGDKISELMESVYSKSDEINKSENLSPIKAGSQDELYHQNKPILTGVDNNTLYTYLLQEADCRDEDTWRIHLMDLKEQGFNPDVLITDEAKGLLSANQKEFQDALHYYDVFHALDKIQKTQKYFTNRFKSSTADRKDIMTYPDSASVVADALQIEHQYAQIKSTLNTLSSWMHHDILLKAGSDFETRSSLFDFIIEELKKLEAIHPHRIRALRVTLENKKDTLLNFVQEMNKEFQQLSNASGFSTESLWSMCELMRCSIGSDKYAIKLVPLMDIFGDQFDDIESEVFAILERTHHASSCCENINGRVGRRIRARQNITQKFLNALRFYLNHKPFHRSAVPGRSKKTPAELLTGKPHPHWLEMLGYTLFKQATA